MKNRLFDALIPILPKNELSHWVGRLAHQPLPEPLAQASVALFARAYNINMSEAEYPIDHYKTVGELFTRKLKPGARPIGVSPVVHPADALITEAGKIEKLTLIQAKGKDYRVDELLRSSHFAEVFEGGTYLTYYLCPTDYHRVHAPVDGRIVWSCHIPGELWPVNSWSVNAIPSLFSINERVAVVIETPRGRVALVMVAATNVGNISMAFDSNINTSDRQHERPARERVYDPAIEVKRGDEMGLFKMGSTVVMLYEKSVLDPAGGDWRNRHVKVGQDVVR